MQDEVERIIDSYYEDSVELADNKFLIFKRIHDHKQTGRRAAIVYLEDRILGTLIELGIYFDASWKFVTPMTEKLFWSTVKSHRSESKEVFNRIRSRVPGSRELLAYNVKFSRLMENTSSTLTKLKRIFNGEVQDNNDTN